ncbi:hypothetical protein CEXT_293861 [Caerostris extrusa]|uniref:Uncharacterized protein n=1 Tax=Caerostris extrusa TaxID=172846 RepID=A0AAV4XFF9_CAEEX|nr:hypothetical protein CEXT_293861 [Caerostris extrusa]
MEMRSPVREDLFIGFEWSEKAFVVFAVVERFSLGSWEISARGNRQSKPSPGSPAKTISDLPAQRLLIPDYISELPPHLQKQQSLLRNIEESLCSFFYEPRGRTYNFLVLSRQTS